MRNEVQPWNQIRIWLEVVDEGTPVTGLSPTCGIQRLSDGQHLQSGGGWGGSGSALSMTASQAGLYVYVVDPDELSLDDVGYRAVVTESTTYDILEYVHITPLIPATLETIDPGDLTEGTLGDLIARMVGLRQHNVRVKPSAWAANGQPTAGTIYLYEDAAGVAADASGNGTGAIASYSFAATFSGNNLTGYTSTKLS